jgi:hypothetical protein
MVVHRIRHSRSREFVRPDDVGMSPADI